MELDYFLLFTALVFIVMMMAVFGKRNTPSAYGDQFSNGYSAYSKPPAPAPQQPIIIVNNRLAPTSSLRSGGQGFAAVLVVSLALYFYVTDSNEKRGISPVQVKPTQSTPLKDSVPRSTYSDIQKIYGGPSGK